MRCANSSSILCVVGARAAISEWRMENEPVTGVQHFGIVSIMPRRSQDSLTVYHVYFQEPETNKLATMLASVCPSHGTPDSGLCPLTYQRRRHQPPQNNTTAQHSQPWSPSAATLPQSDGLHNGVVVRSSCCNHISSTLLVGRSWHSTGVQCRHGGLKFASCAQTVQDPMTHGNSNPYSDFTGQITRLATQLHAPIVSWLSRSIMTDAASRH